MTDCKFGLFYLHFRGVTPCVSSWSGSRGPEKDHRGPDQSSSPGQRQRNDHQVHLSSQTSTHVLIDTHAHGSIYSCFLLSDKLQFFYSLSQSEALLLFSLIPSLHLLFSLFDVVFLYLLTLSLLLSLSL